MRRARDISAGSYPILASAQRLKSTLAVDAAGHINQTTEANWETQFKRWIRVDYRDSTETIVGDGAQSQRQIKVALRYDSESATMTPGMRWLAGTRVMSVVGLPADFDGLRRELVMTCQEVG